MEFAPWQTSAVDFGVSNNRWILNLPIGGRKTATTSVWAKALNAKRVLIVAPSQVQGHWVDEAKVWFPEMRVFEFRGSPTRRHQVAIEFADHDGPAALVTGYSLMRIDVAQLLALGFDTAIADEAHRLKDRSALQTKEFRKLARRAKNLALLTGNDSLIVNSADELWSLLNLCAPSEYTSYWRWVNEHFEIEMPMYGYSLKPVRKVVGLKPGHEELVRAEVQRWLYTADIKVVSTDPIHTVLPVELSPAERKALKAIEEQGWVQLRGDDSEVLLTPNAVAQTTRARQITSDWGSIDPELAYGTKVKATISLISDLAPHPVVVMSYFRATAERIAEATNGVTFLGGMSQAAQRAAKEAFVTGRTSVFSATLGAAAEGLDGLQKVSRDIVLVDRDWTPKGNDQVIGRLQRSGQEQQVRVWHIVARDSSDEKVAKALAHKDEEVAKLNLSGWQR